MRAAVILAVVSGCDDSNAPSITVDARYPLESWDLMQDFGVWNSNWQGYHLAEDSWAEGGDTV